jgi:hypothetical protein
VAERCLSAAQEGIPIPDLTALSLRARLAIALRLFAGYCQRHGLAHPQVTAYLDYLWRFIGLPRSPEAFNQWQADPPALVETGLGYDYPPGFEALLAARGVPEQEFRYALSSATEVLYGSMYAAADESGSRRFVGELAALAASLGVGFPDLRPFSGSRWSDGHGWGACPTPEELAAWRATPVQG